MKLISRPPSGGINRSTVSPYDRLKFLKDTLKRQQAAGCPEVAIRKLKLDIANVESLL